MRVESAEIAGLTVAQTARRLGVSESFVRYLIRLGEVRTVRTALGHLIPPEEVDRLAQERAARRRAQD